MTNTDIKDKWVSWLLFVLLSLIWGSSFMLMKRGMYGAGNVPTLSAYQVAALRILSAGVVLLPFAVKHLYSIPGKVTLSIASSGLLGSFIPAFLFCIAETRIDSSLAGFLNALTPISTIVVGVLFFQSRFKRSKLLAVLIAFSGMVLLFLANRQQNFQHMIYAGFVVLATLCYALNVHVVNRQLQHIPSTVIASLAFSLLIPLCLLVLYSSGFFELEFNSEQWLSVGAATLLGVMGTAVASIIFYMLMKKAGPLFSSMVTYGIPFVALGWGLAAGEQVYPLQLAGLSIILIGVFMANR